AIPLSSLVQPSSGRALRRAQAVIADHGRNLNCRDAMISRDTIFWEVDVQRDFMLPKGKLYVPGAERLIPNLSRLADAARRGKVFLSSSADAHNPNDSEFQVWPPHCLKGTPGADLLPEACADSRCVIPNEKGFAIPSALDSYQQVTLSKNTLD